MNHEQIEAIAAVLRESPGLTEVEVRNGAGVSLRLRRPSRRVPPPAAATSTAVPASVNAPPAAAARTESGNDSRPVPLVATVVGVFRPLSGDAAISPGTVVKEGQVLGHIEAMRLLNDCLAPEAGTVQSVLVDEGQPVEYGQLLFEIATTS